VTSAPAAATETSDPLRLARVDLSAIASNTAVIAGLAGRRGVIAMVGANGLGHGRLEAARTVLDAGAALLAVPDLEEARQLRAAGIDAPVITWLHAPGDMAVAAELGTTPAISSLAQYEEAVEAGVATAHLVPGIGGEQPGIPAAEWPELCRRAALASAPLITGLMATATGPDARERFVEATVAALEAELPIEHVHGIDYEPGDDFDGDTAVRVGAPLFGLSDRVGTRTGSTLRPAMTLQAAVVGLKGSAAGVGVSYGYRYVTSAQTTLAMVAIGYADGIDRAAGNLVPVQLGGERFTVAGRVAMDALVLDVGDLSVTPGEYATLFGDPATGAPHIDEWADALGTTSAEIVARIARRVPRSHE
jgi:alanine racemase